MATMSGVGRALAAAGLSAVLVAPALGQVGGAVGAPAPGGRSGAPMGRRASARAQARWDRIARALDLSDSQRQGIRQILQDAARRRARIVGDANLTPQEKRARLVALRAETRQRIGALLTPEQRRKARELLRRSAGRGEARPGGGFGARQWPGPALGQRSGPRQRAFGPAAQRPGRAAGDVGDVSDVARRRMAMLARYLDLTPDQRHRIRPILEGQMRVVRALRQDRSLTPQQRRERVAAVRQDGRKRIASVLTPEQRQKLEALIARREARPFGPGGGPRRSEDASDGAAGEGAGHAGAPDQAGGRRDMGVWR